MRLIVKYLTVQSINLNTLFVVHRSDKIINFELKLMQCLLS